MRIEKNLIVSFEDDENVVVPATVKGLDEKSEELPMTFAKIKTIKVEDGNTVFHAQNDCMILTKEKKLVVGSENSVIPNDDSVIEIGDNAFLGNELLTNIVLPETVIKIGYRAFRGTGIKEIVLPESLEVIDSLAFSSCNGLKKIFIGKNVRVIGVGILAGCNSLTEIEVDKGNKYYRSQNNCLIERGTERVIACINDAVIPEGVREMAMGTVWFNYDCKRISLPKSLIKIEKDTERNGLLDNFYFCAKGFYLIVKPSSYAETYAKANGIKRKIG